MIALLLLVGCGEPLSGEYSGTCDLSDIDAELAVDVAYDLYGVVGGGVQLTLYDADWLEWAQDAGYTSTVTLDGDLEGTRSWEQLELECSIDDGGLDIRGLMEATIYTDAIDGELALEIDRFWDYSGVCLLVE